MNKLNNKIKDNFTIIPNDIIRNKSLSDRARFIFCYMASMPDDWKFYQGAMAKELGYTKDTLRKYIEELLETGYLNREQRRETGKFDSYDYTLNFTPSGKNTDTVKNRHDKKPTRENSTLINKDFKEKKTITNIDFKEYPENSKEFSPIEINGIEIKEKKNGKVNPFQLISELQKLEEKKSGAKRKEEAEPTERKPNLTYEAFTIFCETFERLSGANYPKDKNGYYLMNPKDAGGMVYLMKNIEKVDRNENSIEALKVFVTAAWNLNDKWIRANFTPNTLYGQFSKIFTGYQTSSPEMIEKKKNDRIAELLAEKMKQYENQ
jgi:DNA-binding MarR family transcriptional regulator